MPAKGGRTGSTGGWLIGGTGPTKIGLDAGVTGPGTRSGGATNFPPSIGRSIGRTGDAMGRDIAGDMGREIGMGIGEMGIAPGRAIGIWPGARRDPGICIGEGDGIDIGRIGDGGCITVG
ncbi:MAG: hypothetical protein ACYDCM_01485 [Candidatus Acidiferrales bacterium]